MKKKLCLALSGALCLSAGVGCGTETAEETLTPVRLNEVVHSVFYAPQYVAQELGFFEEEGLDVSVAVGNGADKSMTALLSDSADIALLGTEAGLYVYAEGKADYPKTFAQLTQRAGNFLVSREKEPDFQWSDLEGKSVIGGRLGGMPDMVLEYVIKENGMTIGKDMEIINNIDFTSTAGAFLGEVGDYTVEFEPAATTLEQSGKGHIVASLGEASGYVPYTVYMAFCRRNCKGNSAAVCRNRPRYPHHHRGALSETGYLENRPDRFPRRLCPHPENHDGRKGAFAGNPL